MTRLTKSLLFAVVLLLFTLGWLIVSFRVELYQKVAARTSCKILFLGDSLTAQAGVWGWWLDRWCPDTQNFGRAGADLFQIGLIATEVVPVLRPTCVVIMAGANDPARHDLATMKADYLTLIKNVQVSPDTKQIIIVSTLYCRDGSHTETFAALNAFLIEECQRTGLTFLDLRPNLCREGRLRTDYARDVVHLNAQGYAVWAAELKLLMNAGL
jgi:lysophospholipase L1-like esterase